MGGDNGVWSMYFYAERTLDKVGPDGVGLWTGKSLEQLQAERGPVRVVSLEEAQRLTDEAASTMPEEIEEHEFTDALECMPPMKWRGSAQRMESFRLCEAYDGTVHYAFVRIGERHFKFRQPLSRTHDDLCRMVVEAFPEVLA